MTINGHIQIPLDDQQDFVDADSFSAAFQLHPTSAVVISADSADGPVAMAVSSLSSVSGKPPAVVFSLSALSYATKGLLEAPTVVLHLMNSSQKWLAQLGATGGAERFTDESIWEFLPTGEPAYKGCRVRLRVKILQRVEVGTGTVCIALVIGADRQRDSDGERALVHLSGQWHELSDASMI